MASSANPWLWRRVLAFAHQGGAREGPSSTLWAIERALDAGAEAIELDVHATADGRLVVCHDPTLERTTDGSGPVAGHALAEIAALDAAWSFVPGEGACPGRPPVDYPLRGLAGADERLRLATLDAVLDAFPGVPLNLDVKQTAPEVPAYEALLVERLRAHGRGDDVIVAAFDERSTDAVAALAPEIHRSAGRRSVAAFVDAVRLGEPAPAGIGRYVALQVPSRVLGHDLVTQAFVERAHEAGLAVHVWTIDDPDEMRRLVALGVDGIMTDVPSELSRVLSETSSAWRRGSAV